MAVSIATWLYLRKCCPSFNLFGQFVSPLKIDDARVIGGFRILRRSAKCTRRPNLRAARKKGLQGWHCVKDKFWKFGCYNTVDLSDIVFLTSAKKCEVNWSWKQVQRVMSWPNNHIHEFHIISSFSRNYGRTDTTQRSLISNAPSLRSGKIPCRHFGLIIVAYNFSCLHLFREFCLFYSF